MISKEINEIEAKRIQMLSETESCFIEKINKIENLRQTNQKRKPNEIKAKRRILQQIA
jgi:hypothetical protein